MKALKLPCGWRTLGTLPPLDGKNAKDYRTEDIWFAESPDGRIAIDVGWYPDGDPEGGFRCMLVLNRNWASPNEEMETLDPKAIWTWVTKKLSQAGRAKGPRSRLDAPEGVGDACIHADFNALVESDLISLETKGAQESLREHPVRARDWVWLTDQDSLRVGARIVKRKGRFYARVFWETLVRRKQERIP